MNQNGLMKNYSYIVFCAKTFKFQKINFEHNKKMNYDLLKQKFEN